jgi:hypothetical protein
MIPTRSADDINPTVFSFAIARTLLIIDIKIPSSEVLGTTRHGVLGQHLRFD